MNRVTDVMNFILIQYKSIMKKNTLYVAIGVLLIASLIVAMQSRETFNVKYYTPAKNNGVTIPPGTLSISPNTNIVKLEIPQGYNVRGYPTQKCSGTSFSTYTNTTESIAKPLRCLFVQKNK
jgi:hypothetical protein